MIKNIILFLIAFYALSTRAQGLRDVCENAHYATGYVKLHQYKLVIDWAKVSDHGLVQLENIVYGDQFLVLSEKNIQETTKTIFTLKEAQKADSIDIEIALGELRVLSFNNISCLYDI